jgi:hypothetical protein
VNVDQDLTDAGLADVADRDRTWTFDGGSGRRGSFVLALERAVVARVMTEVICGAEPREAIRAIALGMFDAIDAHPWVGAQLSCEPRRSASPNERNSTPRPRA